MIRIMIKSLKRNHEGFQIDYEAEMIMYCVMDCLIKSRRKNLLTSLFGGRGVS